MTATAQQKVKVKVDRKPSGFVVKSTHELPQAIDVRAALPPKLRSIVSPSFWHGIGLYAWMNSCGPRVSAKEWSHAIATATLRGLQSGGGETELVGTEPAFLSIGNQLYRLEATDRLATPIKALPALRKNVMEAAKHEAAQIVEAGQREKDRLIGQATEELRGLNNQIANADLELGRLRLTIDNIPPPWLMHSDRRIRYFDGELKVLITINFNLTYLEYLDYYWAAIPNVPSVPMKVWTSLKPRDKARPISYELRSDKYILPHCSQQACCLAVGDCPAAITSEVELDAWAVKVSRAMAGVNLNSLLISARRWSDFVWQFIPADELATALRAENWVAEIKKVKCDPRPVVGQVFSTKVEEEGDAPTTE